MQSTPQPCPDCGHPNPPDARACEACNFPLGEAAAPEPPRSKAPAPGAEPPARPLARPRPRRRRSAEPVVTRLYMVFGVIVAGCLVWIALSENVKRASQPAVEGAGADQLKRAEQLRDVLARDSSNVEAHVALGNILYDTGNWSEAIIHYKAALERDSTRVPVLVDLGVCYYNLGSPDAAQGYFEHALRLEPHQPVAHFNMGVIHENRKEWKEALAAYHRALEADPPEELKQAVIAGMQRIQQATGKAPPPLPQ